ncbi:DUF3465 domain-containing protein [Shewanella sp.]|uniref:DUF3465 domain-containing protein n=1 Tax=Shewanella sp. TaxID=50422 RepID=UPI001EBB960A|nr:DUF3465 domain-containing protein [Shewanella sp.]NRB22594.1 DUF3465 domain-containing protein [Shewanella sp.]
MRKLSISIFVVFALLQWANIAEAITLKEAYQSQKSNVQVKGKGTVIRILRDDNNGSRHQKFILKLALGQTILIAHNIDLAPRVSSIAKGDLVQFYGEYEWNNKGGVVHWTHRDPNNKHINGWLKHEGHMYQ